MKDREQFEIQLHAPLPGRAKAAPTPEALEQEGSEFMSFMTTMTGQTA